MNACFVITAHGYGHASRQMEVIRSLLSRDEEARAVVLTAAPESVFRDYLGALPNVFLRLSIAPYRADVGLVQRDGLTMDRDATLDALEAAWGDATRAEARLADALAAHAPSIVIGDIPPVAFGAAARLGVPSLAIGNFDWAFIYETYAEHDARFRRWAELAMRWQHQASLALQLDPGPRLRGFPKVIPAGVLARTRLSQLDMATVRERLRIPHGHRAVLVSFGGFGLSDPARWMPEIEGVTWVVAAPMRDPGRSDARFVGDGEGISYLDLVASADAVLTKPGYGIVAEAAAHRTRVLYTDRGDFPEYPHLVRWLHAHAVAVHLPSSSVGPAAIADALGRLFEAPDQWPEPPEGGAVAAEAIERLSGA